MRIRQEIMLKQKAKGFRLVVPEGEPRDLHNDEGKRGLPAHTKSGLLGASVDFPVAEGRLRMEPWQGIYLCEHRNHGGVRRIVATVHGE
ncbi:MAG: YjbQ family protein [Burkholderiales bacterium]